MSAYNYALHLASVKTALEDGAMPSRAVSSLEQGLLSDFRKLRSERIASMSVSMVKAMLEKDRSKAMHLIHSNARAFDAMAEEINFVMSMISATVTDEIRKGWPEFHWTPKEQSALVAAVQMGDKTKMTTGEMEFRGFDGEDAINYLLSWKKEDWAKKAQPAILKELSNQLDIMVVDPVLDPLFYGGRKPLEVSRRFGMMSYKTLWSATGKLATGKELFARGAGDAAIERARHQIDEALNGRDRKYGQEWLESRPLAGNPYIEDMEEKLNDLIALKDARGEASDQWEANIGKIVTFNNAMVDWVGDDSVYKLPDGSGLDDWMKVQRMSIHTRLVDNLTVDKGMLKTMDDLHQNVVDALDRVDMLMGGDE